MKELRVLTRKTPQTRICPNCAKEFAPYKKQTFCQDRCQWAYNARQRRLKKSTTVYLENCVHCQHPIAPPRRNFCSVTCKNLYSNKKAGYKYTHKFRGKNYQNFLGQLVHKAERVRADLNKEKLVALYESQKGLCAITKQPMTFISGKGKIYTNISIDRIDSSKGYELDNVQLVCYIVNIMKNNFSIDELRKWCYNILRGSTNKERNNNG